MNRRFLTGLVLSVCVVLGFPWISTFSFLKFIQWSQGIHVRGDWVPHYWPLGEFEIHHISLQWKDRLQVLSGDGKINFDPFLFPFFLGQLEFDARNLDVAWHRKRDGDKVSEPIRINQLRAKLEFRLNQEPVVHWFEIDSPQIQFQLKGKP